MPSRSPWKRLSMVRRPRLAARAICVSGFCGTTFPSKAPAACWLMARVSCVSVRHRRHLPGERVLETEVAQVPHALRKEDAVEMIHLVLHDASVKPLHGTVDRCSPQIESPVAQAAETRHETSHPRHGQTTLPALILLGRERRDKRVDQHGVRYGREVRIARIVLELEDDHACAHADLRG